MVQRSGRLSLHIFAALAIGLASGAGLARAGVPWLDRVLAAVAPIGRLWLEALTMTVVPLVFALLVTGVAEAAGAAAGRLARRTLGWFALLLLAAALVSGLVATGLLALSPVAGGALALGSGAATVPPPGEGDWLAALSLVNPIRAAADTAMLPLVLFALLFGLSATRVATPLRESLLTFTRAVVETMLVIVHWVLLLAPAGVLALAFGVGARFGLGAAGDLVHYMLVIVACCLSAALLTSLVAMLVGRVSPWAFARAAIRPQIVAASTQSSLASLPAMIEAAPALGVERGRAGVVLPLAVSLFRVGSSAGNMAVAVYLAHLGGVPPSAALLLVGAATAALVSLAAVGLPSQVSFFATIVPICSVFGAPVELLAVLLAVETVPDIFRTVANVTGDLSVLRIVGVERTG